VAEVQQQLDQHKGRSLVIAGDSQPPAVHAIAHAMNDALGNVGTTVRYIQPVAPPPNDDETLEALCRDIDAGQVDTLVLLDSNPVYSAPADLNFVERLKKVRLRVHAGQYADETAFWSQWHVPLSHALESWSDLRAFNGVASIVQPLIQPLYATHTSHEVLAVLQGQTNPQASYDIVRDYWRPRLPKDRFEPAWRESLHLGLVAGEAAQEVRVSPNLQAIVRSIHTSPTTAPATTQSTSASGMDIIFRPDPTVWDGEYANNAWLQELPKPLTKLTWDNAACLSPATAQRLSVANEDVIRLRHHDRELEAAVFVVPGQADDCVALTLGYGRHARTLRVGSRAGFNAYAIRTAGAPWFAEGLQVSRADRTYPLATTQRHFNMEGRDIVRTIAANEIGSEHVRPGHADHHMPAEAANKTGAMRRVPLSIYPDNLPSDPPYKTYAWGMSIDLSSCIGCNACVVACVAENNIPMVGKEQVARAREMHWLRIDTYHWSDDADAAAHLNNPQTTFQPMLCQHCEKAPCEVVCPVAATSHSDDGLNEMTYNRCIGTRYCSNNCPYKVRRFNFFEYNAPEQTPPQRRMQYNPDVTVRSRGVMEKCTFCVQRIRQGEIEARKQDRRVFDGEIVPACAQACPTQAIVFGDITDPKALVHELKFGRPFEELDYGVLNEELGTRPRTTYLKKIVHESPSPGTPGEGRGEGSATTQPARHP
jgi:molybdopterin-containing oxidoreductase family iron-sulfur binding subunit